MSEVQLGIVILAVTTFILFSGVPVAFGLTIVLTIRGGQNRREFLRAGGLGVAGVTIAGLLRREAAVAHVVRP